MFVDISELIQISYSLVNRRTFQHSSNGRPIDQALELCGVLSLERFTHYEHVVQSLLKFEHMSF